MICKRKSSVATNVVVFASVSIFVALIASIVYLVKRGYEQKSIDDKCWSYVNNSFYERAIEYVKSLNGNKSPSTYACLGIAYYNTGNLELALENLKKAEELQEDKLHKYDDLDLDFNIYTHIAKILYKMKRYDEAVRYYEKALEKTKFRSDYGDVLVEIAKIYEEKGDIDNAIKYYQDALTNDCCNYTDGKAEIYRKLAELYEKKGNKAQTERYLGIASELSKLEQESK